ncbi:MAG: beta-N-acetylhexosaminidase [Opitutales bacterium]|nr:beta-N-acetylhexosaminidase [Opitutales bacterium]
MKTLASLFLAVALCVPVVIFGNDVRNVVFPEPQKIEISADAGTTSEAAKNLRFCIDASCGNEGYRLEILPEEIVVSHATEAGKFYAKKTLEQLKNHYGNALPLLRIEDAPAMRWRGLHLDVSRHFFSVEEIKKFIDTMAFYKFNRLHFHLTDGPGWRIEIKKYPRLTQIGAWRIDKTDREWNWRETEIPLGGNAETRKLYGGFYTQDEIRELVRFAKTRHVVIVPEIEMPGHSFAAMMAYPELACAGNNVPADGLRGKDMVCVGKPETTQFFIDVLSEVAALFPESPIHVGGDEVWHECWLDCPDCRARMKRENLKSSVELQTVFMRDIIAFLKKQNREIIAWDEIFAGGLSDAHVATMVWREPELGYRAAERGPVILCPGEWLYFDMYQGKPESEPLAIGGFIPLEKVYEFSPFPQELSEKARKNILGIQANLWTEYMTTIAHVEYMLFPRAFALMDIAWHGAPRDYARLLEQIRLQLPNLKARNCNFRPLEK